MRQYSACLGGPEARAQVLLALTSPDEQEAQIAQVYLRRRPITNVNEIRDVTSNVAQMNDPTAQVRALDTLAGQQVSDPESLEQLAQLFLVASSLDVQAAIAGILIRSDYQAIATLNLAQELRESSLTAAGPLGPGRHSSSPPAGRVAFPSVFPTSLGRRYRPLSGPGWHGDDAANLAPDRTPGAGGDPMAGAPRPLWHTSARILVSTRWGFMPAVTRVALLVVLLLAVGAHDARADKKTVCTITVNSPDEKETVSPEPARGRLSVCRAGGARAARLAGIGLPKGCSLRRASHLRSFR